MGHTAMFPTPPEIPPDAADKMTNPPPAEPEISESDQIDYEWTADD